MNCFVLTKLQPSSRICRPLCFASLVRRTLFKHSQNGSVKNLQGEIEKEEKMENQDVVLNLINNKIQLMSRKMIDENYLLKDQIKSTEFKYETLMVDINNSIKADISSLEEKIIKLNENVDYLKDLINMSIKFEEDKDKDWPKSLKTKNDYDDSTTEKEEDIDFEPLDKDDTEDIWDASLIGSLKGVKYHYEQNPSFIDKPDENYNDYCPLHFASEYGHLSIVRFILSKEVDVNQRDISLSTPLMKASSIGDLSIVNLLLNKGADINLKDNCNYTALDLAVLGNKVDVVKVLIERGANKMKENIRFYPHWI